ncbi:hypothetical protein [Providencia manganoxydans]|uniref:hypothetical protein n=1 Tax=Providencia manganoxydans TaxID=2923283 RepID=UPI0034E48F96
MSTQNTSSPVTFPGPFLWLSEYTPDGFIIMKGQKFDKNIYPMLGRMFPDGVLPDTRRGHTHDGFPISQIVRLM